MARIDLGLGIIVALGLLAGVALAMGMGMGQPSPMMQANTNMVEEYEDRGYNDHGPMGPMMGMGPYGNMEQICHEEMEEHMGYGEMQAWNESTPFHDDDDRFFRTYNVSGTIVDVSDRFNAIKVETDDGEEIWIKITSRYIDVDTGYLVAGPWITEVIEDMIDANETLTINAVVAGARGGPRVAMGLALEIPELGFYYETPIYFDYTR